MHSRRQNTICALWGICYPTMGGPTPCTGGRKLRTLRMRWVILRALCTSLAACVTPVGAEPTSPARLTGAARLAPATVLERAQRDYEWLHAHPELSGLEEKTSQYLAERLRSLGFRVRDKVGG